MLCDRKGVVTTSLGIKEVSLKHSGLFHYTNFMMWSLPLYQSSTSQKVTNSIFQLFQPSHIGRIYFISLLQPTQSENTFISSLSKSVCSPATSYHFHQLATTFWYIPQSCFTRSVATTTSWSLVLSYPMWYMLYTSARVILLKHLEIMLLLRSKPSQAFSFHQGKSKISYSK